MREQGYVYIDVRTPEEVELGAPRGAYNVPLELITPEGTERNRDFVRVMRGAFAVDDKLVIGCATGVRSLRAAQLLVDAGFTQVVDQRAGMAGAKDAFGRLVERGWQALGLPIAEIDADRGSSATIQRPRYSAPGHPKKDT